MRVVFAHPPCSAQRCGLFASLNWLLADAPDVHTLRTQEKRVVLANDAVLTPTLRTLAKSANATLTTAPVNSHKLHGLLHGTLLPSKDELKVVRSPCGAIAKTYPLEHKRTLEAVKSEWSVPSLTKESRLIVPWGSALLTKTARGVEFTLLQDDGGADVVDIEMTHLLNHNNEPHLGRIVTLVEDVARGLKELHAMGFIHEDIKPENLVYSQEAGYRIIDFDMASRAGSGGRCNLRTRGTMLYLAPEKRLRLPFSCFASDVWSLGMTAASLLDNDTLDVCIDGIDFSSTTRILAKIREYLQGTSYTPAAQGGIIRLLGTMLRVDPSERITPDQILLFIKSLRRHLPELGEESE